MNSFTVTGKIFKKEEGYLELKLERYHDGVVLEVEYDYIKIALDDNLTRMVTAGCEVGDTVAINGMIQRDENGETILKAQRVSFLAKATNENTETSTNNEETVEANE